MRMATVTAQVGTMRSDEGRACSVTGARALLSTSVMDRLRATLAETSRLLEDFELEQQEPNVEIYRKCCRRFVDYIATHMDISPGFSEQMEHVIQSSHNNLDGLALRSLLTGELWIRYNPRVDTDVEATTIPSTPARQGPDTKLEEDANGAVAVTPLVVANASVTRSRPTCSPHVDLTVSTPPTAVRGAKRQSKRGGLAPQEAKRVRHTVVRNLYGAGRLDGEEKEDSELEGAKESETESETEIHVCDNRELNQREETRMSSGEDGGEFIWPCTTGNPLGRTPSYTQRLKDAIKLVDAENCCPPPGKLCTQGCSIIRARMCDTHRGQNGTAMPCHNAMCCIWRQVDSHLVRCQNSQCEFKNHVGLRKTMHDIEHQLLKLESTNNKLTQTKATLQGAAFDDGGARNRCGSSASQLENEIKMLEEKCTKLEDSVAFHKEREQTFLDDLITIGSLGNDELRWMASFKDHYA